MLLQRVRRAAEERSAPTGGDGKPLLPLDHVLDLLEGHPLVVYLGVDVQDVHRALVALHKADGGGGGPEPSTHTLDDRTATSRGRCPHCDEGHEMLDAREGCRVCDSCGAVLSHSVNVVREWVDRAPGRLDDEQRASAVRGVSAHLVRRLATDDVKSSSYRADLEHWNQFTHLTTDELDHADATLARWTAPPVGREVRIAAVLLRPRIVLPTDVRTRLSRGEAIGVMEDPTPVPHFTCATCGSRVHTRKEARRHCHFLKRHRGAATSSATSCTDESNGG